MLAVVFSVRLLARSLFPVTCPFHLSDDGVAHAFSPNAYTTSDIYPLSSPGALRLLFPLSDYLPVPFVRLLARSICLMTVFHRQSHHGHTVYNHNVLSLRGGRRQVFSLSDYFSVLFV